MNRHTNHEDLSDTFLNYTNIDTIAQTELHECMEVLEGKKPHEVDEQTLENTFLARALIFFTNDASGNLRAVPGYDPRKVTPSPLT